MCIRDRLLQPKETVLQPHLPRARPSLVPRDAQLQAWGGKPEAAASFCCQSPCESRDCCAAVSVPSGSELPSSLMLIQYIIRAWHLFFFSFFFTWFQDTYMQVLMYLVPGLHPPQKKNRRPVDEIAPKKQNKNQQPKYRALPSSSTKQSAQQRVREQRRQGRTIPTGLARCRKESVSYTHLTLPTIYSV